MSKSNPAVAKAAEAAIKLWALKQAAAAKGK